MNINMFILFGILLLLFVVAVFCFGSKDNKRRHSVPILTLKSSVFMENLFSFEVFRRIRLTEVKLISLCLILPVVVLGCEPEETYPLKVSFETYLPYETACDGADFADEEVCIVNSEKQLKSHIVCEDIKLPKVNFAKHSLLLVKGSLSCGITDINVSLSKEDADKYVMDVTVFTNMTLDAPSWLISIVTPKIKDTDVITLNVKQTNS